jgi:hypothetical protein
VYYFDASVLGVAIPLASLRNDVIYPGHPACPGVNPGDKDHEWLPEAGRQGWVVVMRDKHIRTRPGERQALIDSGVRTFCLTGAGNASRWDVLTLLVTNWPAMERTALEVPGPFIYSITRVGVRDLALRRGTPPVR